MRHMTAVGRLRNWTLFNGNLNVHVVLITSISACDWYRTHVFRKCWHKQTSLFFMKRCTLQSFVNHQLQIYAMSLDPPIGSSPTCISSVNGVLVL